MNLPPVYWTCFKEFSFHSVAETFLCYFDAKRRYGGGPPAHAPRGTRPDRADSRRHAAVCSVYSDLILRGCFTTTSPAIPHPAIFIISHSWCDELLTGDQSGILPQRALITAAAAAAARRRRSEWTRARARLTAGHHYRLTALILNV